MAFLLELGGGALQSLALLLVLLEVWQGAGAGLSSNALCLILRSRSLVEGLAGY